MMGEANPADTRREHGAWMRAVADHGDRVAFRRLYDHYAPRMKSYLIRSGSSADLAEELVQDCMATIWRKAGSFDPDQASVSTWMFTIVRNRRIDYFRRGRGAQALDADDPMLLPEAAPLADSVVSAAEDAARIARVIAELPPEQAEMLRLAYYEDMAHSEIAAETQLPLGTVKSRLRLALARMRKALELDDEA